MNGIIQKIYEKSDISIDFTKVIGMITVGENSPLYTYDGVTETTCKVFVLACSSNTNYDDLCYTVAWFSASIASDNQVYNFQKISEDRHTAKNVKLPVNVYSIRVSYNNNNRITAYLYNGNQAVVQNGYLAIAFKQ